MLKSKRLRISLALLMTTIALGACSKGSVTTADDLAFPETGSEIPASQIALSPALVANGTTAYISADSVRVRKLPEAGDNVAGRVFANDEVVILSSEPTGKEQFVEIKIVKSNSTLDRNQKLYIVKQFLSAKPVNADSATTSVSIPPEAAPRAIGQKPVASNRLFVVTNIASEKIRVYQRCLPTERCVNRMIMEAGVVNGESKDGTRTNAGFFQVSSWTKFYETSAYPAWYRPGYPPVPKPDSRSSWFDSEYLPNGKGVMRGAFGWYTAKVAPNADGQWTHGTGGWGEDKTSFITFKDGFGGWFLGLFASIRSHGCTRTDNESIAYLRQLMSVGTPLIKIYAREGYRDETRLTYNEVPAKWEYILTKVGNQQIGNHQLADRATVLAQGTPQSEWLDQGTYQIDQYPDAEDGDIYRIGSSNFQGVFLVDEGTLLDYKTPAGVGRGGYSDQVAPPYMITTSGTVPAAKVSSSGRSRGRDQRNEYGN